mmetsp:Transcript_28061/g.61564  ORF Transcript_28061/g.61564 Transcript_28061/m.61564 type:complete len:238 (-) Transcript_28061:2633-3346(-)
MNTNYMVYITALQASPCHTFVPSTSEEASSLAIKPSSRTGTSATLTRKPTSAAALFPSSSNNGCSETATCSPFGAALVSSCSSLLSPLLTCSESPGQRIDTLGADDGIEDLPTDRPKEPPYALPKNLLASIPVDALPSPLFFLVLGDSEVETESGARVSTFFPSLEGILVEDLRLWTAFLRKKSSFGTKISRRTAVDVKKMMSAPTTKRAEGLSLTNTIIGAPVSHACRRLPLTMAM